MSVYTTGDHPEPQINMGRALDAGLISLYNGGCFDRGGEGFGKLDQFIRLHWLLRVNVSHCVDEFKDSHMTVIVTSLPAQRAYVVHWIHTI